MITLFQSFFAPPRHLILLLAALWLGLALAEKRVDQHHISKDALNNLVYYSILGYIIGGRVFFALANLTAFTTSPFSVFSININLFDPVGAVITALMIGFIYGQHQKLPLWTILDALTPMFATLAIGLSLSHLAAGTAFGKPTTLPWGINLWNATRHPSQIYELIASLFIFGLIWFRKTDSPSGSDFFLFTILTAGASLFLQAFRGDSILIVGGIRLEQFIAWLILALAFFLSETMRRQEKAA